VALRKAGERYSGCEFRYTDRGCRVSRLRREGVLRRRSDSKNRKGAHLSVHGSDDPNIPAAPIPDPGGVRDGRGTPVDSRTPPPVARTGSQFKTSNLRLVVLGLVVLVVIVAILVGSRG
jgi:hypothetical protein